MRTDSSPCSSISLGLPSAHLVRSCLREVQNQTGEAVSRFSRLYELGLSKAYLEDHVKIEQRNAHRRVSYSVVDLKWITGDRQKLLGVCTL
jgi:hypothetical protein